MRMVSGIFSDRTRQYWLITFIGYLLTLVAIPLLAFAHRWEWAAALLVLERIGKGLRSPPRDALLSFATRETGRGWGFAIHEAMDQIGAVTGPLLVLGILFVSKNNYPLAFKWLAVPAVFFSLLAQLASLPLYYWVKKNESH